MNSKNIWNKDICFIAHGHSLSTLEANIDRFKNLDVTWVSLNNYHIAQDILDKIGKKLDVVCLFPSEYDNENPDCVILRKSKGRGNSLSEFLHQCNENNVKRVFLFGADGYSDSGVEFYKDKGRNIRQGHKRDTEEFNKTFKCDITVYNVSPNSYYEVFPKITIEKCLSLLLSQS